MTVATNSCSYVKISQAEADRLLEEKMQNFSNFPLVQNVSAEPVNSDTLGNMGMSESLSTLGDQLTLPFYLLLISFFVFIFIMSVIYIYHWTQFNLNDKFIRNFVPIYLIGILILSAPLIFNLF